MSSSTSTVSASHPLGQHLGPPVYATGQPIPSTLDIKQFNQAMKKAVNSYARSYIDAISISIQWGGDEYKSGQGYN